jgi:hypothetical protein
MLGVVMPGVIILSVAAPTLACLKILKTLKNVYVTYGPIQIKILVMYDKTFFYTVS